MILHWNEWNNKINWNLTLYQYERLDISYRTFLRRMVRDGFQYVDISDNDYRYSLENAQLHLICGTKDVSVFTKLQQKATQHIWYECLVNGQQKC